MAILTLINSEKIQEYAIVELVNSPVFRFRVETEILNSNFTYEVEDGVFIERNVSGGINHEIIHTYDTPYTGLVKIRVTQGLDKIKLMDIFSGFEYTQNTKPIYRLTPDFLKQFPGLKTFSINSNGTDRVNSHIMNGDWGNVPLHLNRFKMSNMNFPENHSVVFNFESIPQGCSLDDIDITLSGGGSTNGIKLQGSMDIGLNKALSFKKLFINGSETDSNYATLNIENLPTSIEHIDIRGMGGSIRALNNTSLDIFATRSVNLINVYLDGIISKIGGELNNFSDTVKAISIDTDDNIVYGDLNNISTLPSIERLNINGLNTVSGDISDLPSSLKYVTIRGFNTIHGDIIDLNVNENCSMDIQGQNEITGDIQYLPKGSVSIGGNNTLYGNIQNTPNAYQDSVSDISIQGLNTISGQLSGYPRRAINLGGYNTVGGHFSVIRGDVLNVHIEGNNVINGYTPRSWNSVSSIVLGGNNTLTNQDVDNLLIDLSTSTWTGARVISLKTAPRTSASDAAYNTLLSKGVTVTFLT